MKWATKIGSLISFFIISMSAGLSQASENFYGGDLSKASQNYTTISCNSSVLVTRTYDWDSDSYSVNGVGYINASIHAAIYATRGGCGREYRASFKVKGSTVLPSGAQGPIATINKSVSNACSLSAGKTDELLSYGGGFNQACGAHYEYTWTVNGVAQSTIVNEGCSGYYVDPPDSETQISNSSNCQYPPENSANGSLGIPVADADVATCNGSYLLTWDAVPAVTKYEVWRLKAGANTTKNSSYILEASPVVTYSLQNVPVDSTYTWWVRACTSSSCGFFSAGVSKSYYSGCP